MAEENNSNGKKSEGEPHGENPEFDNFQRLLKQVLSASKEKIDEQRAEHERGIQQRRTG